MDSESSLPIHVRLPFVPVLSQVIPVHALKPISLRSILTLSCNLWLGHLSLFPSGFPSISLYVPHLSPIHATCPLYHVWFADIHNMSTDHKGLYCAVFSSLLFPHPSKAQISSSAPYSQTHLASVWETKFHSHIKQQAKL